jgi:hypothetical protein
VGVEVDVVVGLVLVFELGPEVVVVPFDPEVST